MEANAAQSTSADTALFEQLDSYDWDSDEDFKNGLEAILGANPSPEQAAELTLRARCFYYDRKYNVNVDFDGYRTWRSQHAKLPIKADPSDITIVQSAQVSSQSSDQSSAAPYPTSFAQIVDLIKSGRDVPGIKEIPDTVLAGQGTTSSVAKRKKPWEKAPSQAEASITTLQEGV